MLVTDFDFDLPSSQIAQAPRPRGQSRLMVLRRDGGAREERSIAELPQVLDSSDLMVFNDTRVFPARLLGRREPSGGTVECLLLERVDAQHWQALVHPGQRLKPGARVMFERPERAPGVVLRAEILERLFFGRRLIRFEPDTSLDVDAAVDLIGHVPLPPYIHRDDHEQDRERYQTVFARVRGSVAAPTAGLHFNAALLGALSAKGIQRTGITHHVGYGTFKPVRSEDVESHRVDAESYEIPPDAAAAIHAARAASRRVLAVGTTTTRALESATDEHGRVRLGRGVTELFMYPGYRFRAVDALLTNFHLPRSSLLMLVAAFAGRELVLDAYRDAVARGFQFYSYGDAMLIL